MCFSAAAPSENDHGNMNLASNTSARFNRLPMDVYSGRVCRRRLSEKSKELPIRPFRSEQKCCRPRQRTSSFRKESASQLPNMWNDRPNVEDGVDAAGLGARREARAVIEKPLSFPYFDE
jgi:hypothetical protein